MKFGQSKDCTVKNFFFKNHAENDLDLTRSNVFLFFEKALYKLRTSGHHFSINILVALELDIE